MYFLGKYQGGFVDVSAIFKNSDMYWSRMFWEALQFRCCGLKPVPVMENTLTWQKAEGIFPAFPANNYLTEITTRSNCKFSKFAQDQWDGSHDSLVHAFSMSASSFCMKKALF